MPLILDLPSLTSGSHSPEPSNSPSLGRVPSPVIYFLGELPLSLAT